MFCQIKTEQLTKRIRTQGGRTMSTKVWAHRGASGYAPENTLEAFELAAKQKADGVELDVQLSKDGELKVVIHDEIIDRVTDGKGKVKDYTVRKLKSFKANQTHPEYANSVIPTLAECMIFETDQLEINVELKTGIYFYPDIEKNC